MTCHREYDAKIGNLYYREKNKKEKTKNNFSSKKQKSVQLPHYLLELYKFTAVHHNIPKEKETEHDKDVLTMKSQDTAFLPG